MGYAGQMYVWQSKSESERKRERCNSNTHVLSNVLWGI